MENILTYTEFITESTDSVDNPNSKAGKMIKKKSEQSGISQGILKKVYKKGMAAWNTGHIPGVSQSQWSTGRVNSFITGSGGARKADADLWKKAKKQKERKKKKKTNEELSYNEIDQLHFQDYTILSYSSFINEGETFDKIIQKLKTAAKTGVLTTVMVTKLLSSAYGLNPEQKEQVKDVAKKANIEMAIDGNDQPQTLKTIQKNLNQEGNWKMTQKPFGQIDDNTEFKTFSGVGQTYASAQSQAFENAKINVSDPNLLRLAGMITVNLKNGNYKVIYLIHTEKPQPINLNDKETVGDKIKTQTQKIGGDIKTQTQKIGQLFKK
jgi:hypothetical protein